MYQAAETATEQQQAEFIRLHGEHMSETVVLTWMDDGGLNPDKHAILKRALELTLKATLTDLELAELASRCVQGPTFEEFCEEQS